ncbi:beta-ketoacyl synthase [Streptomyces sp. NRRL B-1140]|nr:beta-ketoacyl synthase [Streptomyces sp. NRRL B-1140]
MAADDLTGNYPADRPKPGPAERGGYLTDALAFDADFFGISPREARNLDPQHRLLLEVAWEAFEDAAIPPETVAGSAGVYVGITGQDHRSWAEEDPSPSWLIGNGHCFAAGRLAHTLGLGGPALAIDTACSSSLVAIHQAARALTAGDCDVALAGGVNLILGPRSTMDISRTSALSPDGRCRPFDASANGFVRGEGCGMLILKRLPDAERDGDRVLGVIEGVGINHDGNSTGFTAPDVDAQRRLIESVLATSGRTCSDVGYLEAHGTGTALGDPIELSAAAEALGGNRTWHVGSVKSVIGHTEAAAGVLGLLKVLLVLEHSTVPPQGGFGKLNPRIEERGGFVVPRSAVPLDAAAGRLAAVSSFGMSGTNAHALLSGPVPAARRVEPTDGFLVSAHTDEALRALADRYAAALPDDDAAFAAFASTVTRGRTRLRKAVWAKAGTPAQAREALRALAAGVPDARVQPLTDDDALPEPHPGRMVVTVPGYPWQRRPFSLQPLS